MKTTLLTLTIYFLVFGCQPKQIETEITDPYIWLEEIESAKSLEWINARNEESASFIKNNPLYEDLKAKFLETYDDTDKIAYPNLVGKYVYNLWQDEDNERGIWRRMLAIDFIAKKTQWEVILDLDELSARENKKWVFKGVRWLAPENNICLLFLSDGGKDEIEIREFDVRTKNFIENGFYIKESKGEANWLDSNTILVASDFGEGTLTTSGYPRIIKKWERNTSLSEAQQLMSIDSSEVEVYPVKYYSNGQQYTFIIRRISFFEQELYYLAANQLLKVNIPLDAEIHGFHKNELILALQSDWTTNQKTYATGSLISFDLEKFMNNESTVKIIYQPDPKSSFVGLNSSKDFVVINTLQNVKSRLIKCQLIGDIWKNEEIETPDFSSIYLVSSDNQSNHYFFRYSNLITPTTLVYGNGETVQQLKTLHPVFNTENLIINQLETTSKDGTIIPYFIVHKDDLEFDGENATLIKAYGGFNVSSRPYYSKVIGIGWLEQGGVYVLANIRGGGEFGPQWHKSAMKEKRQNAYDDFFAVAEDLIKRKITSPEFLGIYGWSNGGLLTGVALTQRPELYNAVVVGAPLLDMKRYNKLLAGASWMGEYGDPDIPEDWEYISKYSPYQNVYADKTYPEPLFITSIKDDRVHPGHARKMAAKMMEMGHPVLYHETIEGGHGAASTNSQRAEIDATIYTYLNMKLKKEGAVHD